MADEPENIKLFKEMAGRILGTLYKTHPRAIFYDYMAFFDKEAEGDEEDLFDDTLMYLVENGYLASAHANHVRLNDRSYHILQKPNPLHPEEAIGSSLAKWAVGTASEVGKSTITQAAGSALTMLYTILKSGG